MFGKCSDLGRRIFSRFVCNCRQITAEVGVPQGLNPHAVFRPVERAVFASVAEALVGHALGEALLAQFVSKIEGAGHDTESDACPHEYQEWATEIETHISGASLRPFRNYPRHEFKPSHKC
jgi:hypothetical protein